MKMKKSVQISGAKKRKSAFQRTTLMSELLICELSSRKRIHKMIEITQRNIDTAKKIFRQFLRRRKEECLELYKEFLDKDETRLIAEFEKRCDGHFDRTFHFGNEEEYCEDWSPPSYCRDMLEKPDLSLFLKNDEIFEQVTNDAELLSLRGESIILDDDPVRFLDSKPLGDIQIVSDRYDIKTLDVTFKCALKSQFGTNVKFQLECMKKWLPDDIDAKFVQASMGNCIKDMKEHAILKDINVSTQLKIRGNELFRKRQYRDAQYYYTKAIEFCPTDAPELAVFHQNRAAACQEEGDLFDECVDDCTEALKINPRYIKALVRRRKAYDSSSQLDLAFQDAVTASFYDTAANKQKHDYSILSIECGEDFANDYLQKDSLLLPVALHTIQSYLNDFNCLHLFHVPIQKNSKEDTLYTMIMQDLEKGSYDQITSKCTEVIRFNGTHKHRAFLLRGTLRLCQHDIHNAHKDFDLVLSGLKNNNSLESRRLKLDALVKRARLKSFTDDYKGFQNDVEQAMLLDDRDAVVHHNKAKVGVIWCDRGCGEEEETVEDYRTAISLDESFVAPRLSLGEFLYMEAKRTSSAARMQEADDVLRECVSLFPKDCEAWWKYGRFLLKIGRVEESLEKINKAIDISPRCAQCYAVKGLILLEKQDKTGAEKFCKMALDIDTNCYESNSLFGQIKMMCGEYEEAIEHFDKSIRFTPRTLDELNGTLALLHECKIIMKLHP
jgi:import receptor subunit TOM70